MSKLSGLSILPTERNIKPPFDSLLTMLDILKTKLVRSESRANYWWSIFDSKTSLKWKKTYSKAGLFSFVGLEYVRNLIFIISDELCSC